MDFSTPATAHLALWTITRLAALAVLVTEALFLWSRRSEPSSAGPLTARFVWAATPALILAGLSLWCLGSLAAGASTTLGAGPTSVAWLLTH